MLMHNGRQLVNLALIGFMGTGKTSAGRLVAEQLRFEFLDTDELIQIRTGRTISDIFAHDGEPVFRQLEQDLVGSLESNRRTVISTGGGLPTNPENLASLKRHAWWFACGLRRKESGNGCATSRIARCSRIPIPRPRSGNYSNSATPFTGKPTC